MASSKQINHSDCIKKWRINTFNFKSDGQNKYTDTVLVPNDPNSDKRFHCHRVVLASASPYFKNLFQDSNRDKSVHFPHFEDLSANILEILIDYMYKAEIRITLANVILINKYSSEFSLNELNEETKKFLENNIQFDTCLEYMRHADYWRNTNLLEKCVEFIQRNPEDFMEFSVNFLTEDEMIKVCKKLRGLNYDSIILSYIIVWVQKDFDIRKFKLEALLENINLDRLDDNNIKALEIDELQSSDAIKNFIIKYYKNNNRINLL